MGKGGTWPCSFVVQKHDLCSSVSHDFRPLFPRKIALIPLFHKLPGKDNTNAIYETTDTQKQKNCNIGTALERSV